MQLAVNVKRIGYFFAVCFEAAVKIVELDAREETGDAVEELLQREPKSESVR